MELHQTHAFHQLHYHFVWTTKNRESLITSTLEKRLYPFLTKKTAELGAEVLALGGTEDHVHLLVRLAPKQAPAKFIKDLKGSSSHFLTHESGLGVDFKWQAGYGIFSVGSKEVPFIEDYIRKQKEHHGVGEIVAEWEASTTE